MTRVCFLTIVFPFMIFSLFAQGSEFGNHQYTLRGEVFVDLEPIYAGHIDDEYPLDITAANRRALDEAAYLFSAMIYGWSFSYVPGEAARQLEEILELEQLGSIQAGDPALRVTDVSIRDMRLWMWSDYHL